MRKRAGITDPRVVGEVGGARYGAGVTARTLADTRDQLRLACGTRIEAVAAGALPRFESKARRVVHIEECRSGVWQAPGGPCGSWRPGTRL